MGRSKEFSEKTAQDIDSEVRRIIDEQYKIAEQIILTHRDKLDLIAKALLEYETLEGGQVEEIIRTGTFTPPVKPTDLNPPSGAQAATALPEVPRPVPPKIDPGLASPSPIIA